MEFLYGLIPVAVIMAAVWGRIQQNRNRKKQEERRIAEFGMDPLKMPDAKRRKQRFDEIRIYYESIQNQLPADRIDETTWNDLDMDEVFYRLDHTRSFIGEQTLYAKLHEPDGKMDFSKWEEQLSFYEKEEKERLKMEEMLEGIGKSREDYYLPTFLLNAQNLKIEHAALYRVLQLLLAAGLLGSIFTRHPLVIAALILNALVNLTLYSIAKWKYEVYLYSLGSVKQLVGFGKMLISRPEFNRLFADPETETAIKKLEPMGRLIGNFQMRKRGVVTGDILEILRDYLWGVTLWDITQYNWIMRLLDGKQKELLLLYEFVGQVDIGIAAASFRKSVPHYCVPQFTEDNRMHMTELYHPLLEKPVYNDFAPEKNCLITGANASGKSTFIKALAVNAIIGQTLHTCCAKEAYMPAFRIMSSMAVRDDILSGESYYMKEVRYLKRIMDALKEERPVFCVIDEILRGTNTAERFAASEAILRYLEKESCLAVVATHDVELAAKLSGLYECYYFDSSIREADVRFDYRLRKGIGNTRNAIELLDSLGFPEEIVRDARSFAAAGTPLV